MKRKNLMIGVLLLLAMLVSGFTYAYWASSITGNLDTATGTITIGDADAVTTTVVVENETNVGPLVPVGITGINNVNLTFSVLWTSDDALGAEAFEGTISVMIDSVMIGTTDVSHLFTIDVTTADLSVIEDISKDIVINIEFTNEPADQAEYDLVANGSLVVTITFTVIPN